MSQTLRKPLSLTLCHDACQFNRKWDMELMWNIISAFLEHFKELFRSHCIPTFIMLRMWWWYLQIFRRRWKSLVFIRASWLWFRYPSIPFFQTAKQWWLQSCDTKKTPTGEDITTRLYLLSLRPVSFRYDTTNGHTPTIFVTISTGPGTKKSFVMMAFRNAGQDAIQIRVSSNGLLQIPSLRMGPGSHTHTQQSAGGNASSAGDQMWDTPRAWHGTHFPNSLQKPLAEHADQQHPIILAEL